jgi:type IV secretion system protein VirB1
MQVSLLTALALAAQCAPSVAPETLLSVVRVESGFNPLVIGVNGASRVNLTPASVDEAVVQASSLIGSGRNVDLGLAQINSKNLRWLGLSLEQVFDPCANLAAAARILQAGYKRTDAAQVGQQVALRAALSFYNTGNPQRGFHNGYVARVERAATQFPIPRASKDASGVAPSVAAGWDVFGDLRTTTFVSSPSTPLGDQP